MTNSFLQNPEEIEKKKFFALSQSVIKKKQESAKQKKPMFILISEKKIGEIADEVYKPYASCDKLNKAHSTPIKDNKVTRGLRQYTIVPLKKFNSLTIPESIAKSQISFSQKNLRKFKF